MPMITKEPEVPLRFYLGHVLTMFAGIGLIFIYTKFRGIADWYIGWLGFLIFLFGLTNLIKFKKTKKESFFDIKNPYIGALVLIVIWLISRLFIRHSLWFGFILILMYYYAYFKKPKND
ncbi:MAG: hypothetical protein PHV16_02365 [Candidatus Nanoarchaeia archaeon]|nr:hypothetical protein [Candidatus Nanoarchaeia archaeon]